ncbi:DNA mismatch repair protein [Pseudoxanthomonas dokdonensis]|uniref:DNA mismatch repair protein MutL n=1 Tax=Pseudoxanthomonas dokdonensis TaxID=344882 RepID=A0A0R0CU88_9GAMM|nr:DNA mismatch repair protein [Pseudoxanthomonas dokdonensis]
MRRPPVPIRQLPETLINQIAAGEVVERPSSVVKELVENALDAGATRVDITLEEGGARLIRIRDNGIGIAADELPLAVCRHATSKIASLDDLEAVSTLGFRGEALPSIASVSRFSLTSRPAGSEHGHGLLVDGGKAGQVSPKPHPPGTTVEVRDLFYNVPARKKFLRAERTEFGHVEEWLRSLLLARPDIELRISHNDKSTRRYPASRSDPMQRLRDTLSAEFAEHALQIEHAAADMRVHGWIALPGHTRASAQQQYLYVNGRPVRDRNMAHAIKSGYQDVVFHGRYPACVLFLELDPRRVDVNVHPAKHEVRFRDARMVHDFIQRTLHEALADTRAQSNQSWQSQSDVPAYQHAATTSWWAGGTGTPSARSIADTRAAYQQLYAAPAAPVAKNHAGNTTEAAATGVPALGYAIAQLHGRYILAENAQGLVIVDPSDAQTRQAKALLEAALRKGPLATQALLLPETFAVDDDACASVQSCLDVWKQLGFDLLVKADAIEIRGVPMLLAHLEVVGLVRTLLSMQPASVQVWVDALSAYAGQAMQRRLSLTEMNALMRSIEAASGGNGALARGVAVHRSLAEIEQWFDRGK